MWWSKGWTTGPPCWLVSNNGIQGTGVGKHWEAALESTNVTNEVRADRRKEREKGEKKVEGAAQLTQGHV